MPSAPALELDAQYRQLREEAGLLVRDGRGVIAVTGPDGAEYLQGQVTNDVEALAVGEGQYAALLDRKGHMQTDLRVLRVADEEIQVDLEPAPKGGALRHLTMYSIGRDVAVADATAERVLLSLIGPRAAEVASAPPLPEFANEKVTVAGIEALAV